MVNYDSVHWITIKQVTMSNPNGDTITGAPRLMDCTSETTGTGIESPTSAKRKVRDSLALLYPDDKIFEIGRDPMSEQVAPIIASLPPDHGYREVDAYMLATYLDARLFGYLLTDIGERKARPKGKGKKAEEAPPVEDESGDDGDESGKKGAGKKKQTNEKGPIQCEYSFSLEPVTILTIGGSRARSVRSGVGEDGEARTEGGFGQASRIIQRGIYVQQWTYNAMRGNKLLHEHDLEKFEDALAQYPQLTVSASRPGIGMMDVIKVVHKRDPRNLPIFQATPHEVTAGLNYQDGVLSYRPVRDGLTVTSVRNVVTIETR